MERQPSNTQCLAPYITVDENTGEMISCPCGRCPACLKRRAAGWAFRLQQEEKVSDSALFVTLTYDTRYIPITKQGTFTLEKTDIQKFFKRLRWNQKQNGLLRPLPIKYFAVGEYGSDNGRPHYHTIVFNSSQEDILQSWKDSKKNQPIGNVHFGTVTAASIAYTLKYMLKSGRKFKKSDLRKPEFQLMSKKLGLSYLNAKTQLWHKNNLEDRMYLTTDQNQKVAMPRYYKEKLYDKNEKILIGLTMQETMGRVEETPSQKRERAINAHYLMNKNTDKNDKL